MDCWKVPHVKTNINRPWIPLWPWWHHRVLHVTTLLFVASYNISPSNRHDPSQFYLHSPDILLQTIVTVHPKNIHTIYPHFPICSLLQSSSAFRKTKGQQHNNHQWRLRVSEVSRAPSPWSHFHRENDFQLGFTFLRRRRWSDPPSKLVPDCGCV